MTTIRALWTLAALAGCTPGEEPPEPAGPGLNQSAAALPVLMAAGPEPDDEGTPVAPDSAVGPRTPTADRAWGPASTSVVAVPKGVASLVRLERIARGLD